MPLTPQEELLLLDYQDRLREGDLTDEQRQALRAEIARFTEAAPTPLDLRPQPVDVPSPGMMSLQAELEARRQGREAAEERPYTTPRQFRELEERETERAREQIRQQRDVMVIPGVEGTVPVDDAGIFRPTRIRYVQEPLTPMEELNLLDLQEALETVDNPLERQRIEDRIRDLQPRTVAYYRDPETGGFRPATAREEFQEARSQQILATEQEARRQAGRGEAPLGILARQQEGVGIVETPLQQTIRTVFNTIEATLGEAYVRGLGFEVDEEGNPLNPEDWAYQAREALRRYKDITGVELIPESFALGEFVTGPFTAPLRFADYATVNALEYMTGQDIPSLTDAYEYAMRETPLGIAVVPGLLAPSTSTTQKSTTLDPEGRMVVSDIEVPSFWQDQIGFFDAETRRLARNIASGRGLMDEARDSPAGADFAKRIYGHEDWAYIGGLPFMIATPATPAGLVKPAVTGLRVAGKALSAVEDWTKILARASRDVATMAQPKMVRQIEDFFDTDIMRGVAEVNERAFDPRLYAEVGTFLKNEARRRMSSDTLNRLDTFLRTTPTAPGEVNAAEAARAAQAHAGYAYSNAVDRGGPIRRAYEVIRGGRSSDDMVNQRWTEAVLRMVGADDDTVKAIMESLDFARLRTTGTFGKADEAWFKITKALDRTGRLDAAQLQKAEKLLRLNIPEDYVMITDTFAAPRAHAAQARASINKAAKARFSASVEDVQKYLSVLSQTEAGKRPEAQKAIAELFQRLQRHASTPTKREIAVDYVKPEEITRVLRLVDDQYRGQKGVETAETVLSTGPEDLLRFFNYNIGDAEAVGTGKLGLLDIVNGRPVPLAKQSDLDAIVESIASNSLLDGVNDVVRRARDVGQGQMYLNNRQSTVENLVRGVWDTPLSRKLLAVVKDPTVSELNLQAVRLRDDIRRAGRLAGPRITQELLGTVKAGLKAGQRKTGLDYEATVDAVAKVLTGEDLLNSSLDDVLERGLTELGISTDAAWDKVFSLLYGEAVAKEDILAQLNRAGMENVTTKYPTIQSMMAVDSQVSQKTPVENIAKPFRFNTPDFQGIAMGLYLDEVFNRLIAGEVIASRLQAAGMNVSLWQEAGKVLGLDVPNLRSLVLNPAVRAQVEKLAEEKPLTNIPGPHGFNTPDFGMDRLVEAKLAASPWEFVEYVGKVSPRGRQALAEVMKQGAGYLGGNARLSLQQGMKYGWFMPNLRTAVFKGVTAPFVMASQVGIMKALETVPGALRRAVTTSLKQRNGGLRPGVSSSRYGWVNGPRLVKEAELRGVGYTSVSAERVYNLAEDIFHAVRIGLPKQLQPKTSLSRMSPLQKTFWMRTAEAMDRSFRQGVFEARIAAGDTFDEAARVARKILFDYDEVPPLIQQKLGGAFQGAASTYKLVTELVLAGMRNPRSVSGYLKLLEQNQRRQDPYGIGGDESLLNFRIDTSNGSYLIRVPGANIVDLGMNMLLYADTGVKNLAAIQRAWRNRDASDIVDALTSVAYDGTTPLVYSTLAAGLGNTVAAYMEFEATQPMERRTESIRQMSDEKLMWAALINARTADPTGEDGIWDFVWTNLDPVVQDPPPEFQVGETRYWSRVPKNKPHIYMGEVEGQAAYMIVEPSGRARTFLAALRALPENTQALYNAGVGYYFGNEAMGVNGGPVPLKFYAQGAVPTTLVDAALSLVANPTFVDYTKPEVERAEQAETYLRARAMTELPEQP
jgi:hypothetical protein